MALNGISPSHLFVGYAQSPDKILTCKIGRSVIHLRQFRHNPLADFMSVKSAEFVTRGFAEPLVSALTIIVVFDFIAETPKVSHQ